jgi:hypothetical protein
MRKVSLGIGFYATVSVVLSLGACMKPVGVSDLLNDDRTKEIIGGKEKEEGVKGGIGYTHPRDLKPTLSNGGTLTEDDVVTVSVSGAPPNSMIITASPPAGITYSNIVWYCNDTEIQTGGDTYTITAGYDQFFEKHIYQLMVMGTAGGISYSTWIFILVEP